ncbi:MAG: hypothetical protein AAFP93_02035 [Bacteroidota bacterium]
MIYIPKPTDYFRTYGGAEQFCITRGLLATARKQKNNIIEATQEPYPLKSTV